MAIVGITLSAGNLLAIASVATTGYLLAHCIYNIFFHPLRSFPGPLFWRASRLPYCFSMLSGSLPFTVLELHQQYGDVVRIAPDELSFADGLRAWRDMMGHRGPGEPEMQKAPKFYKTVRTAPVTLITAGREEHGVLRRQLAHGFSERSMRDQQPIITQYIDLLVKRLHENSKGGSKALDMVRYYNYTTFDVIGDLAFGEPFGCLEKDEYHPWVGMIFSSIKLGAYFQAANHFPWIKTALLAMVPKGMLKKRREHQRLTKETLLRRMDLDVERPDFIEGFLQKRDELGMSMKQLQGMSGLLIVAGSETTASTLSGVTYLLATNPDALEKLTKEVRGAFTSEDEIDFQSVSNLPYMLACLNEGLRVYPVVPGGMPRITNPGGDEVAGRFVPEKTMVSQFHYALYHNEKFFSLPNEYHPERWLGDPRFAEDNRDAFQPFHVGPRNCIGKNLAYVEMRLILARVIWNFDLKLADDSKDWLSRQKIYLLWQKGPLNMYLTPRAEE